MLLRKSFPSVQIELKRDMTVVAALRSANSILLCADSGASELDLLLVEKKKLYRHSKAPLAWGVAGNPTVGRDLSQWMQACDWPPADWYGFKDSVASKMAELNKRQRDLIVTSGAEPQEDDLCTLLVACQFEGPKIFEISAGIGINDVQPDQNFDAIGSGGVAAKIAHFTLERIIDIARYDMSQTDRLAFVMATCLRLVRSCGPPLAKIIQVSTSGVSEIRSESVDSLNKLYAKL